MNEKLTASEPFPNVNDHLQYQKSRQVKKYSHQDLSTPEAAVARLVLQVQTRYRKGHQLIQERVSFPMKQIEGLTLKPDELASDPNKRQKLQLERLEEIFRPLIDQAFDASSLTGKTTVELHGKGCSLKADYQVRTPKQFKQ